MKIYLAVLASLLLVSTAHASRETVKCVEVGSARLKDSIVFNFDPAVSLNVVTFPDGPNKGLINTYKVGAADVVGQTTAKVVMTLPGYRKPYAGPLPLTEFYEVNLQGNAYADHFSGKTNRSFHGHDKDSRWDTIVYIADAPERQASPKNFPGLLTIQMDLMDQGYYFIDLACSSSVK